MVDSTSPEYVEEVEKGVFRTHHDFGTDAIAITIAVALNEVADEDAVDIIDEFSQYADPDALNRLFRPLQNGQDRRNGGRIVLYITGYMITIQSDGEILIREAEA